MSHNRKSSFSQDSSIVSLARGAVILVACLFRLIAFSQDRPDVEHLLQQLESDYYTTDSWNNLEHALRTSPSITPTLIAVLKSEYFDPSPDHHKSIRALAALQFRTDITSDELAIVTNELRKIAQTHKNREEYENEFVHVGLRVLKNYRSKAHEELVLSFAYDDDNHTLLAVCETLGEIGTERSQKMMMDIREKLAREKPEASRLADLDKAIKRIEQRKEQSGNPDVRTQSTKGAL